MKNTNYLFLMNIVWLADVVQLRPMTVQQEQLAVNRTRRLTNNNDASFHKSMLPIHVPKYMLDLFNNVDDSYSSYLHRMTSDRVKSYTNINKDVYKADVGFGNMDDVQNESRATTRTHTLVFNMTPPAIDNVIDYGELRLYTLIARDQHNYQGVDRLVTILLVIPMSDNRSTYEVLDVKHVYEKSNSWETFNVTSAVNMWRNFPFVEQRLQVRIDSLFVSVGGSGQMDIFTHPHEDNEPLLLIYLSDANTRKPQVLPTETEMLEHRVRKRNALEVSPSASTVEEDEEESNAIVTHATTSGQVTEDGVSKSVKTGKRKRLRSPCRRRPMFVQFEEINYDTWIIAPRGYEAFECVGKCYFPLSEHLQPTQHAIVQTLLHTLSPKKASKVCCVPTKLDSISILYVDKDGAITYKYRHEDMVALECGCR